MCRVPPEDLGLPSPEQAYREAATAPYPVTQHKWSHPAVYHAGADTGWFDLRSQPESVMKKKYFQHYSARVKQVMSGDDLQTPENLALVKKPEPVSAPGVAKQHLENARRLLAE